MKKFFLYSIAAASLLLFAGCATVYLTAEGVDKPAAMTASVNKKFTIVKHFREDLKAYFTIFDLVTISNPDVDKLIRSELVAAQGDAIINIRVRGQTTFIDGLIPVGLGVIGALLAPPYGVYASSLIGVRTYTVEGDVIKYTE